MALYSQIEDRYLAALTAVQFPEAPVADTQQPVTDATSVDGMQLAAGPSATVSDAGSGMPEMRATPRNPVMGGVADFVRGVRDLELVECDEPDSCCGFGGLFSVKFPMISTAMAEVKGGSLARTGCDYIVSSDPSCQLQLDGWLSRQGKKPRTIHLAEVLAGADA